MISKIADHYRGIGPGIEQGYDIGSVLRPVGVQLEEDQSFDRDHRHFSTRYRGCEMLCQRGIRRWDSEKIDDAEASELAQLIAVDQDG